MLGMNHFEPENLLERAEVAVPVKQRVTLA